jgi:rhodanese-related sulfurtransferase
MTSECELSFQQKSLFQQGYQIYTPRELKQLEWGLRFTPAVCSSITAAALYFQQPYVLFVVAFLGMYAFFFPAGHPMDLIYNHIVRPMFGAVMLPENPFQRRVACFAAGIMNTAAAVLFLFEMPTAAIAVGVILLVLQAIVISTHFCTLSWIYEGLMRMLGLWDVPVDMDTARMLHRHGALVVDVRSQNEYAADTIDGTVNLPLENLADNIREFEGKSCLLFCRTGARSQIALAKLRKQGLEGVHDLGDMSKVRDLIAGTA